MKHYDLIIVGGGLVGAGLAAALRQSDLSIALIDARLPSHDDPRLFALNNSSCQFLENIGVWEKLSQEAAPIHGVHVSRQRYFGTVNLQREDVSANALGHVIPAHHIEKTLHELLITQKNLTRYQPAKLTDLIQQDGVATLTVENENETITLQTNRVIGADGTTSLVRHLAKIETIETDDNQSALVTRTVLQRPHQHIAYERFTDTGAIAMLPLKDLECATIWTGNHATIQDLMGLSDEEFVKTLQKEFGYRLGRLQKLKQRHVFPLRTIKAKHAVEQCILLLGNAAHTLHPIAAQGFNLAIYEVAMLVDGLQKNLPVSQIVEKFQQQQSISMGVSHRLSTLFSKYAGWIKMMSPIGMTAFDLAIPLKKKFIKSMMGRTGTVPPLLLGVNE